MTGLYWKSDAAVTVIRPLLKGTGDPPERHRRGKISKKPGSNFRFGFFLHEPSSSAERSEIDGSRVVVAAYCHWILRLRSE